MLNEKNTNQKGKEGWGVGKLIKDAQQQEEWRNRKTESEVVTPANVKLFLWKGKIMATLAIALRARLAATAAHHPTADSEPVVPSAYARSARLAPQTPIANGWKIAGMTQPFSGATMHIP